MPTELEELVDFLHHGNPQIREIAAENLVGYSQAQPIIFKANDLLPVKDLKHLAEDIPKIAKSALTILINLSGDPVILQNLALDDNFVHTILSQVTDPKSTVTTELCMLIANLSKHPSFQKVLSMQMPGRDTLIPSTSASAFDQMLSVFLLGEDGKYNKNCTFEYLAYAFSELAKFPEARKYFASPQDNDEGRAPLSKVAVFTEHGNIVRRRGVANTIKNVCFQVDQHDNLLKPEFAENDVLPFILLPLMGSEDYPSDEMDDMPEELQLLPPDKKREEDTEIIKTHLDTLLLLTTTKEGRNVLRAKQVYPVVRECHAAIESEEVREACDRFVQVLMRDESNDANDQEISKRSRVVELDNEDNHGEEEDDDYKIIPV